MSRPLLLIDVDGPLNPFAAKPTRRPEGYRTYRLLPASWERAERERLAASGRPGKRPVPLRVWLNPDHGPRLLELPFDLVWCTTWGDDANEWIAPRVGLPTLPVAPLPGSRFRTDNVFWKTPAVVDWAAGRPFAWVDDDVTDADREYVARNHPGPALLITVSPFVGLADDDFEALAAWADRL